MTTQRYLETARSLFCGLPLPLDRMPYREEFEPVYHRFRQMGGGEPSRNDVWEAFVSVRKRGHAPSAGRRASRTRVAGHRAWIAGQLETAKILYNDLPLPLDRMPYRGKTKRGREPLFEADVVVPDPLNGS